MRSPVLEPNTRRAMVPCPLRTLPLPRSTLSAMMPRRRGFVVAALLITISALMLAQSTPSKTGVQQQPFGTKDGRPVTLYTLTNSHGVEVRAMNYGGIILSIRVPDRKGQLADIVLGHDALGGYIPNAAYIG